MEFRVLGPVGAHAGERRIAPVGARQERILAALLLDAGRVVPVSRLVDVVWAADPPATAVRQVRNVTTALRRTLVDAGLPPDALAAVGPGFVLHPPELDLRAFDAHVGRGEHAAALACWRGRALAGVDSPALAGAAAALEERRLSVLHLHLAERVAAGDDVVAELTDLVGEHPLSEGFAGLLMRALRQRGRQADALAVYRQTRRRLVDELGVEPGAELRDAHDQVLREDPAGPCCLPGEPPDFVGRDAELAAVLASLHVPVLIDGMAGVGKTAVAVRAAHRVADRFPDGQLFVDLHGYTPGRERLGPSEALAALLWQLGVPANRQPAGLDERAALWRARTAGRKLLVLLDNAADAAQVVPLLPATPTVAVIITSRRRLTEIDGAVPVPVDPLPSADAAALFAAVSGRADAGVARLCGNLPLAVRIAASRLRQRPHWTIEAFLGRLGRERNRLAELRAGGRDVAATFHLSYQELDADHQRMFRLLGAHPGGVITVSAAAALAELPEEEAERQLDGLLDAHLLEPGYRLHDLLAEHARHLAGADDSAFTRLLAYYRAGGDHHWHAAERASLRAVVHQALDRAEDESAWKIADRAAPHLRDHHDDFRAVAAAATHAAQRLGDPAALHRALGHLADAHWDAGELTAALACTRQRLTLPTTDPTAKAMALSRLGALHGMSGDYRTSADCYHHALTLTTTPDVVALLLGNLSHAQEMLNDLPAALSSAQRSRSLATTPHRYALSTAQEALVLAKLGSHTRAERQAHEAIRTAQASDHPFGTAFTHVDYAEVLLLLGDPVEARTRAHQACEILTHLHHPLLNTMAANTLGTAYLHTGDPHTALTHHRRAHATARRIGYRAQMHRATTGAAQAKAALSAL
ncbi:BTAD domain-containing putative transcriptional regulator [Actinokineospora sp. UTMC 2448]|uniref:AfsR/SARP family transcriptional regulator n=1 Tax=Actinokineospora sp. UTMC 2448 TaxID=2268449 RepID=UPI002164E6F6|nr:BTAD domain-containing putative transcriptional regulator [Actinokineospora sp. UTMC 2448]UVS78740.1 Regulatory protein AfsR [Actinokineospora sp. UTMC 2448]